MLTKFKFHPQGAVLLCLLLGLMGCVSNVAESGTKIDPAKVAQIKKGVTTRAEVEALLGPPAHVSIMPDGGRMLMYNYMSNTTDAHAKATAYIPYVNMFTGGGEAHNQVRTQTLQVVVNAAGRVADYEFSDDTTNTNGETGGLMGMSSTATSTTTGSTTTAEDNAKNSPQTAVPPGSSGP